jgi:alpha-L-fucosidase
MKVNGESIYGTTSSPFKQLTWGRCTKKLTSSGAILYLHVFNWPADSKLIVPALKNEIETAYLLSNKSKQKLGTERTSAGLSISVPNTAPHPISSTVVVIIKGTVQVE